MNDLSQYHSLRKEISDKAEAMKQALLYPVLENADTFIGESAARNEKLTEAVKGTILESAGKSAPQVAATASSALRLFKNQRGRLPSDDVLASAYNAIQNVFECTQGGRKQIGNLVLESANLETTEGILFRDRMVALILPTMLQMVTTNMASMIPGQFNQSEIFRVWRVAGSTFGDYTAGDRLKWDYTGQYSSMDQRHLTLAGNGTKTGSSNEFDFTSTAVFGSAYPMKKKSIRILHDRDIVARDDGNGNLSGTYTVSSTTVTVTGTVNYTTGVIHPVFSTAPANAVEIHVQFDVNIEANPALIPSVNHEMESNVLYPHESAINATTTLQALWGLRREYNLNADSLAMLAMRNLLSADKDRNILRGMNFFKEGSKGYVYTYPQATAQLSLNEFYSSILATLLQIDQEMLANTGTTGLTGIVADNKSITVFKSLGVLGFEAAPGYRAIPQPHYVGRLFGMWDLYNDPFATDWSSLCFGKGPDIAQAGYIAGDAIPALNFKHALQSDLQYNNTLWELSYRDVQPFDGRKYLTELKMTAS